MEQELLSTADEHCFIVVIRIITLSPWQPYIQREVSSGRSRSQDSRKLCKHADLREDPYWQDHHP
ncbi:Hypothetical predicted protein [Xyrichtys novacula]|uniref:Uncharacterized protein n=1 Tax=Xyrichtys novacula TaxID=13765 RepID=A0AAV1FVF5_XYRNO|nr:Hypothetical predicted protein [Xyrichtys novacula]